MATITIKGIPDDLYEELRSSAKAHRRSINKEVIYRLERALRTALVNPEETLARIDALRTSLHVPPLTPARLAEARTWGRK